MQRVAFLGPPGTFTEEALLTQPDLAELDFVALENSIEGTVNVSLDSLIFDTNLLIRREVVLPVTLDLLVPSGTALADVSRVVSFPHASAQCRNWFAANLAGV